MDTLRCAAILLLCVCVTPALSQNPSTAEERARLLSIAHKHEANPLDPSLRLDREWALKWLVQAPDILVGMCPSILGDYHKYEYSTEITMQLMLSSAEFVIDNPDKAKDQMAQYLAGAEGVLKAYEAILQQDPKARSKALDEDVEKQKEGKLKESVENAAAKSCPNSK